MVILIPAFEPDRQLPVLIRSMRSTRPDVPIVVVDDGSGPAFRDVFDDVRTLGCHVIGYARNQGKGFALRAGFGFIVDNLPGRDVVCADSDGQHTVTDILRLADRLRGYPAAMLPWLRSVRRDRYEYELNLLLEAQNNGYSIESITIATVYLDLNSGSHFRPFADSARIYAPLLKFLASSFTAFLVDTVVFVLLTVAIDSLLLAVVGARAVSSAVNFLVNRRLVFERGRDSSAGKAGARYFGLVAFLLSANFGLVWVLEAARVPALPAKVLAEAALLAVSFAV